MIKLKNTVKLICWFPVWLCLMIHWHRLGSDKMGTFPTAEEFILHMDSVMPKSVWNLPVTFQSVLLSSIIPLSLAEICKRSRVIVECYDTVKAMAGGRRTQTYFHVSKWQYSQKSMTDIFSLPEPKISETLCSLLGTLTLI